jgi:hypothetical protein
MSCFLSQILFLAFGYVFKLACWFLDLYIHGVCILVLEFGSKKQVLSFYFFFKFFKFKFSVFHSPTPSLVVALTKKKKNISLILLLSQKISNHKYNKKKGRRKVIKLQILVLSACNFISLKSRIF